MKTLLTRRYTAFAGLLGVSLIAGWHAFVETITLSVHDNEYTYILLILPVTAALIWWDRPEVGEGNGWSRILGVTILLLAVSFASTTTFRAARFPSDMKLSLCMLALALFWIGSFAVCFGDRAVRSEIFPLSLWLGLIPLPRAELNSVISLLQTGSAWSAHCLFALIGVPVLQKGDLLTVPGLTVQIAQECSSIRSSSMLLVTTIVLAHIVLRTMWRKLAAIVLALPLSVAKNGLRIFTITMLGTRVDAGYLSGRLHRQGGILFFLVALLGMFAILAFLHRGDDAERGEALHLSESVAISK